LLGKQQSLEAHVKTNTSFYTLPIKEVQEIPVVYWKLIETHEKRLQKMK